MTVVNGQICIDAGELGPAVQKLLGLMREQRVFISKDGEPLAEVVPVAVLPAPDPKLRVHFNVVPEELTGPDDWREAGI